MTNLEPLPDSFPAARSALQRVAVHVLARRRFEVTGRFGLRATPGGFGTPAFGDGPEALRVAGGTLVRETAKGTAAAAIHGSSLRDLAALGGASIDAPFSAGHDTPALGNPDEPVVLDAEGAAALAAWYGFGWRVLDTVIAALGPAAEPSVIQLWPEHFDAGADLAVSPGRRVNIGASPGDGFEPEPYLYVGPQDGARPGDPAFWNAPFGAVMRYRDLRGAGDAAPDGVAFVREGLARLADLGAP